MLNQSFQNFEFLIFDDGSTDSSVEIIKTYTDKRIKAFYSEKNLGYVTHLNRGIRVAKAPYIARMDSDDVCEPQRFQKQIECFDRYPDLSLVFGKTILIDVNGQILCKSWRPDSIKNILKFLPYRSYIPHPTVLVKKDVYLKYGCYDVNKAPAEDLDIWSKFKKGKERFFYLKDVVLMYRINPNSVQNVPGNPAYHPNYFYKLCMECYANNSKVRAIQIAMSFWNKYTLKQRILIVCRVFYPFYFTVIRGYYTARKRATRRAG